MKIDLCETHKHLSPRDCAVRDIMSALQSQHLERVQQLRAAAKVLNYPVHTAEPEYQQIAEELLERELYKEATRTVVERIRKTP